MGRETEIAAELPLQHAVVVLDLLLLAQVGAIVGRLAALGVHARRRVATIDRALGCVAAGRLEEELHPLAATEAANGSSDAGHGSSDGSLSVACVAELARVQAPKSGDFGYGLHYLRYTRRRLG